MVNVLQGNLKKQINFDSPHLLSKRKVRLDLFKQDIRVPFGRRGWEENIERENLFPSPSLEEEGEAGSC